MGDPPEQQTAQKKGLLERGLALFGEVRPGEATTVLLMVLNLFFIYVAYYILKPVREAIVGGAELKAYASAAQALLLMGFIPIYSWLSSRAPRMKLIFWVVLFFAVNLELFNLGAYVGVPYLGFVFFVWLGIFNVAVPAQFWSFANDIYDKDAGKRLFPLIAIGASAGSPLGAKIAKWLFDSGVNPYLMMQLSVLLLLVHIGLTYAVHRRDHARAGAKPTGDQSLDSTNGFMLVFRSPYIRLIALMLILLNLVNTTGEYILTRQVNDLAHLAAVKVAAAGSAAYKSAFNKYMGSFFAEFFFWVNIVSLLTQALLVSRIVKYMGMAGVMFALPIISFGAYGLVLVGAGFTIFRWTKTVENSTDYSVMNTAKALLWLPTTREEKYNAKQAVDTFFVRIGDLLSGGLVFVGGANVFDLSLKSFATVNLALIVVWVLVTWRVFRYNQRLVAERGSEPEAEAA